MNKEELAARDEVEAELQQRRKSVVRSSSAGAPLSTPNGRASSGN
jgi:hypothetical protein